MLLQNQREKWVGYQRLNLGFPWVLASDLSPDTRILSAAATT